VYTHVILIYLFKNRNCVRLYDEVQEEILR